MRRAFPMMAAVSVIALAACQKPADPPRGRAPGSDASTASPAKSADIAAPADEAAIAGRPARNIAETPPPPELALAYRYALTLPADQVRPLMESHQEACERAGPQQCQVMGADARTEGRDQVSARLDLRATPAWMRAFRARAEADAEEAGGKVRGSGVDGEDLSAPIVDAEAAQAARAAERDRLRELMRRHTRDLDQTLQVEQELTRVQGEMDAAAAQIAAMKGRVAMQTLTVEYQSKGMVAPDGPGAPIAQASRNFVAHMAVVFAVLINIASVLAPFVMIGAPVAWWVSRRTKARKAGA